MHQKNQLLPVPKVQKTKVHTEFRLKKGLKLIKLIFIS